MTHLEERGQQLILVLDCLDGLRELGLVSGPVGGGNADAAATIFIRRRHGGDAVGSCRKLPPALPQRYDGISVCLPGRISCFCQFTLTVAPPGCSDDRGVFESGTPCRLSRQCSLGA